MKILGTGMNGLVGSRVIELLKNIHQFENISLETGVDITDSEKIAGIIKSTAAAWVFHFAAFTNVDKAELDRVYGDKGMVWKVNVSATENIVHACAQYNKKLLYISTDYVFDGDKDEYSEEDKPNNPAGWYGITKLAGEKSVLKLDKNGLVVRISNPYRSSWVGKADFVHKIIERMSNNLPIKAPDDQIFIPTYIDDIAFAIDQLVKNNAFGVYHAVGTGALTPFEACRMIADAYSIKDINLEKTSYSEFFSGRAPRPFRANLTNAKIAKYGVFMSSFEEGLQKVVKQEE